MRLLPVVDFVWSRQHGRLGRVGQRHEDTLLAPILVICWKSTV
jgi:hypothetical protein